MLQLNIIISSIIMRQKKIKLADIQKKYMVGKSVWFLQREIIPQKSLKSSKEPARLFKSNSINEYLGFRKTFNIYPYLNGTLKN